MTQRAIAVSAILPQKQMVGGVASYMRNLLRGMALNCEPGEVCSNYDLTVFHTPPEPLYSSDFFKTQSINESLGRFAQESKLAFNYRKSFDAICFLNYFTPPNFGSHRSVTVIHDLQYDHMPENFSRLKRAWLKWCHLRTLKTCSKVITISEVVRQDLLRCYGEKWADRTQAIWNPVDWERFQGESTRDFTSGRPYLLCVAIDRPAKNLATLIRAFGRIRKQFPEHLLVLAGQLRSLAPSEKNRSTGTTNGPPSLVDLVKELDLDDHVKITGFITDEELGTLYRGADLFVLPSLFEGFGMPAIEAIALGAPTLVSGIPVLREITLGKSQYVEDPLDDAEMASHIASILKNVAAARPSEEHVQLVREKFSPKTIARQYLDLMILV